MSKKFVTSLNYDDFNEWYGKKWVLYASASNGLQNKTLYCSLNGNFKVSKNYQEVLTTNRLTEAVDSYNDIII